MPERHYYERALDFATKKHKGQYRRCGEPFISHPVAVAEILKNWGYPIDYRITALFHDLLEDTNATEDEILELSNENVLNAVKLLTKEKNYVMKNYIDGIKTDNMAKVVKAADRIHNLQSAIDTDESFKKKYVLETYEWYMDFSSEIPVVLDELIDSMENPSSMRAVLSNL